jgi:hemerythrin
MLEWSRDYLIGIDRIDFEHEAFFSLIRDFQAARLRHAGKRELQNMLEEIGLYAKFHFRSEENVMEALDYPGLEAHRQKHWDLIESLSNIMVAYSIDSATPERIEEFLVNWFLEHTSKEDRKIAEFKASRPPS